MLGQCAVSRDCEQPTAELPRRELDRISGRINGHYSEVHWAPIRYITRTYPRQSLAGFCRMAQVGVVTPLRDGMNMVAKEYVAAQDPADPGVLVLSRFAGAAAELGSALIVNPFDVDQCADAMHRALVMPLDERQARWRTAMDTIVRNDVKAWWTSFTTRLGAALDRKRVRAAESLTREMAVARNIQRDFLPETLPAALGVELDAALHPARDVSGDFYDAFVLEHGTIVLVVGDVCDKGFGAALFMALFRSLIRASADPVGGGAIQMIGGRRTLVRQSLESATPADLLTRVAGFTNDYIARLHGRTNMFATAFLGALTPQTGEFDYVNAGHEPALVMAPDGSTRELRPTGPALGLLPGAQFGTGAGRLERGDCLVAFTDGLVEARSPAGEAFGGERLQAALRANHSSASNLVRGVIAAVQGFTGQGDPHDDVTLLAATGTIG